MLSHLTSNAHKHGLGYPWDIKEMWQVAEGPYVRASPFYDVIDCERLE